MGSWAEAILDAVNDPEGLERMGKKSSAKLIAQIDASRSRDLWRLLFGLGIRHVGERGAQILADDFGSVMALRDASLEALQTARDVGPVVADAVRNWFDQPANRDLVDRLAAAGVKMDQPLKSAPAGPQPRSERSSSSSSSVCSTSSTSLGSDSAILALTSSSIRSSDPGSR